MMVNKKKPVDWSQKDVEEWFKKLGINKRIIQKLGVVNGRRLYGIYLFKKESSGDFFYESLICQNMFSK